MGKDANRPVPIVLEVELLDRLSDPVREGRVESVSAIIRTALERFDFSNVVVLRPNQVQISVRLPARLRRSLRALSRKQHVSMAQLVRAALDAYLPELASLSAGQMVMPIEAPRAAPPAAGPKPKRRRRRGGKEERNSRTMTKKRKG